MAWPIYDQFAPMKRLREAAWSTPVLRNRKVSAVCSFPMIAFWGWESRFSLMQARKIERGRTRRREEAVFACVVVYMSIGLLLPECLVTLCT